MREFYHHFPLRMLLHVYYKVVAPVIKSSHSQEKCCLFTRKWLLHVKCCKTVDINGCELSRVLKHISYHVPKFIFFRIRIRFNRIVARRLKSRFPLNVLHIANRFPTFHFPLF